MRKSVTLETLEKGIAFENSVYYPVNPLAQAIVEFSGNTMPYNEAIELSDRFLTALTQFDNIAMPDGTTFKKVFQPK